MSQDGGLRGPTSTLELGAQAQCFAVSPRGDLFAVGGHDGKLRLYSLPDGRLERAFKGTAPTRAHAGEGQIYLIAFSPGGDLIAMNRKSGAIEVWKTSDEACLRRIETGTVGGTEIGFSQAGDQILGTMGHGVCAWSVETGAIVRRTAFEANPRNIHLHVGRDVVIGVDHVTEELTVRRLDDGTVLHGLTTPNGTCLLATSSAGHRLAFGGRRGIGVVDLDGSSLAWRLDGLCWAFRLALSPDGMRLAWSNTDRLRLVDASSGRLLSTVEAPGGIWDVKFAASSSVVMVAGTDGRLRTWDIKD